MYKNLSEDAVLKLNSDFTLNKFSNNSAELYKSVCNKVIEQINDYLPNIVAISVFTSQSILAAHFLLDQIKAMPNRKNFSVIIGGLGVLNNFKDTNNNEKFGEYCLSNNLTNYYISGDGEKSFVEFLNKNYNYPGINSTTYQQITDLDSIPTPSYKKINPSDYFYSNEPEIVITGSKGCVRDCTFCDVGSYWKKYVYKSGQNIANDMYKIYQTTGVNKFDFSDSLINGSIKSFRQLNKRLIELKQSDSSFCPQYKGQFICRPIGQMKEQDYIDMKNAGVETLVVGIEHFSKPIRTHMRKYFDNDSIDWHFSQCGKHSIKNVLLLLSGYVTETTEDHQINLHYLHKYQKYALSRIIYAINIQSSGLVLHPGAPLYDMAAEIGIVFDDDKNTWYNINNLSLTPKERLRRAAEIICVAAELKYNVLHFDAKVEEINRNATLLNNSTDKKKIPIMQIS